MCEGDDHLAWKHLVSSEACRGLRTTEGMITSARDLLKSTHLLLEPP